MRTDQIPSSASSSHKSSPSAAAAAATAVWRSHGTRMTATHWDDRLRTLDWNGREIYFQFASHLVHSLFRYYSAGASVCVCLFS